MKLSAINVSKNVNKVSMKLMAQGQLLKPPNKTQNHVKLQNIFISQLLQHTR